MKKIICNTPGKGREKNPYSYKFSHLEWSNWNHEHPEISAFYADGITPLNSGSYEADEVWQYYWPNYMWKPCTDNKPNLAIIAGYETRRVFIASIPAPDAQPVKAVEEDTPYKCNNCGFNFTHIMAKTKPVQSDSKIVHVTICPKCHSEKITVQPSQQPVESKTDKLANAISYDQLLTLPWYWGEENGEVFTHLYKPGYDNINGNYQYFGTSKQGMRIISVNADYVGHTYVEILGDGGTRKLFNGHVRNFEELKLINSLVL